MNHKQSLKTRITALTFIALFSITTQTILAQERVQKTVSTVMSFGDWLVKCEQIDDVVQPCIMSQKILNQDTGQTLIEANLAKNGDATQLTFVFPLGMYLPEGITLEVIDWAKRRYDYNFCVSSGCIVNQQLDQEIIDFLRKKEKATIMIHTSKDQEVSVPFSIDGFLDAYKKL